MGSSLILISSIILISLIFFSTASDVLESIVVTTKNGPYRGERRGYYYAFEGIRYAEPPISSLRFADPVPYTAYHNDIWNVTVPGDECIQYDGFMEGIHGSEDCLFLNVYTKQPNEFDAKLPVVVHIHGGGFIFGQGVEYGPEHLMQRNVVYVNFNYRLGIMGFLSASTVGIAGVKGISGNMGLKDQVMLLKWVQANIQSFGGDPSNVTLVGWSAGGASVQFHYVSPMSKGLFARGISHSGSMFNPWTWQTIPEWRFYEVCLQLSCVNDEYPFTKRIECLRNVSAEKLVNLTIDPLFQPFHGNPFDPFGVVLEQDPTNDNPFLSEKPEEIIKKGAVQKLPLIISGVRDEGYYPGAKFLAHPEIFDEINTKFDNVLPSILGFPAFSEENNKVLGITKIIRERYLGKVPVKQETFEYFVKILTDYLYLSGFHKAIDQLSPIMPTYVYGFDYKTTYGFGEAISGQNKSKGIAHGEDIVLIYDTSVRKNHPFTLEEQTVMGHLLDIYESFAHTGIPKINGTKLNQTTSTEAITFTHIKGPNNFTTITKNLDKFTDKFFWYKIQELLDNSLPNATSSANQEKSIFLLNLMAFSFIPPIIIQIYN
uniref:Carboxylic ester hydrolase n=1 Tax=Culicoides sonorensis TaxID=179676 RepID=A0A336MAE2_CULSO